MVFRIALVATVTALAACTTDPANVGTGNVGMANGPVPQATAGSNMPDVGSAPAAQAEMATLLNVQRAANGLGPLRPNALAARAAQGHAQDMVTNADFSHTGRNGSNVGTRLSAVGYRGCTVAENIAYGMSQAEAVVTGWMGSPGHRANILTPAVTEFGIGRAGNTWVLVLAKPC